MVVSLCFAQGNPQLGLELISLAKWEEMSFNCLPPSKPVNAIGVFLFRLEHLKRAVHGTMITCFVACCLLRYI
jgi:hypothetical protein